MPRPRRKGCGDRCDRVPSHSQVNSRQVLREVEDGGWEGQCKCLCLSVIQTDNSREHRMVGYQVGRKSPSLGGFHSSNAAVEVGCSMK